MNLISHVPFEMCSLRKWCLISMCLVLECMTGFLAKLMALVLSHNRGIWLSKIPKSFNCCLSHMVWAQQLPAAMYSASAVERATHACFLHCHEIKLARPPAPRASFLFRTRCSHVLLQRPHHVHHLHHSRLKTRKGVEVFNRCWCLRSPKHDEDFKTLTVPPIAEKRWGL